MKSLVRCVILLTVTAGLIGLAGCGGGSSTPTGVAITISLSASSQSINAGGTSTITATVANDSSNQGVSWSLSGVGSLGSSTTTTVVYTAPPSVTTTQVVSITATSIASSSVTASIQITVLPSGTSGNVQPITVDGGPVSTSIYPNGAFTSVQVCIPNSTTCTTVDGLLVDTGSTGLRVLSTALNGLALQPITSNGQTLTNCVDFVDGSFLFGQVELADVYIAGEIASSLPIHVVADPTGYSIPCTGGGTDEDNQAALGANGILGVGPEPTDCTLGGLNYCDNTQGQVAPVYYACASGTTCTNVAVSASSQVTHPAVFFQTDNNGVILDFPSVSGGQPTVSGTMTFGIGTQANNGLGTAHIYVMDATDSFTTIYNGTNNTSSFIDSGSNAYFFPDPTINVCTDFTSFYCPLSGGQPTTLNLQAINTDVNNNPIPVPFSVGNTDTLFNNSSNAAYGDLAGPNAAGSFDWGLPFFFGKTVYTTIDGQPVSSGQPAAPWWAY